MPSYEILYDLLEEDYHAIRDRYSASMLKFLRQSAAKLHEAMHRNEEEEKAHFAVGRIAHAMTLEPDKRFDHIAVKPEGMHFGKPEGKAWKAAHADKTILTQEEWDSTVGVTKAICDHPIASGLFVGGRSEVSLFAPDPATGLPLKARLDYLHETGDIVDLKTTKCAEISAFSKEALKLGYHIQAWLYQFIQQLCGLESRRFLFVAVEKTPPFSLCVFEPDYDFMQAGGREARKLLAILLECVKSGVWPHYPGSEEVQSLSLPGWYLKQEGNL